MRVMRVILRALSASAVIGTPDIYTRILCVTAFFFGGARAENITRITRTRADLAANQQLRVRVIHNSILRTITRITRTFP
jgi:hypothetical protein